MDMADSVRIRAKCPKCGSALEETSRPGIAKCIGCASMFRLKTSAPPPAAAAKPLQQSDIPATGAAKPAAQAPTAKSSTVTTTKPVQQVMPTIGAKSTSKLPRTSSIPGIASKTDGAGKNRPLVMAHQRKKSSKAVIISAVVCSAMVLGAVVAFALHGGGGNDKPHTSDKQTETADNSASTTDNTEANNNKSETADAPREDKKPKKIVTEFEKGLKAYLKPEYIVNPDAKLLNEYKSMATSNQQQILDKGLEYFTCALHCLVEDDEALAKASFELLKKMYMKAVNVEEDRFTYNFLAKKDRGEFYLMMHKWHFKAPKTHGDKTTGTLDLSSVDWKSLLTKLRSTGFAIKADNSDTYEFREDTPAHQAYVEIKGYGKKAYPFLYRAISSEDALLSKAVCQVLMDMTGATVPFVTRDKANLDEVLRRWRNILQIHDDEPAGGGKKDTYTE